MEKKQKTPKKSKKQVENKKLVEYEQYEMFTLVTNNEKNEVYVMLANYKIQTFENAALAKFYIDSKPWELIFALVQVICERQKEIEKLKN